MPSGLPYTYSFSGSDCRPYVWFDNHEEKIAPLDTLHTISVSVSEMKAPVRSLGFRNIKGYARADRTIAGSMILVVVRDNPLRPLLDILANVDIESANYDRPFQNVGWSVDRDLTGVGTALNQTSFVNRLGTLIPPFNLLLQYVSEADILNAKPVNASVQDGGDIPGANMLLQGVEIISEGIVTSINDIVSEVTLQFIAEDFKPLAANWVVPYENYMQTKRQRDDAKVREAIRQQKVSSIPAPGTPARVNTDLSPMEWDALDNELLPGAEPGTYRTA